MKPLIRSIHNGSHLLVLKLEASDQTFLNVLQVKEMLCDNDHFLLDQIERQRKEKYTDKINTYEYVNQTRVKDECMIFYYHDHALFVLAKSSKNFEQIKEKIVNLFDFMSK